MNCIFCTIIANNSAQEIIASNSQAIAILDINPVSEGHLLIIPRQHQVDLSTITTDNWNSFLPLIQQLMQALQTKLGAVGFNLVNNCGAIAGQVVPHFHFHLIPKYKKDSGLICTTKPEITRSRQEIAALIQAK